jgi:hypothetical protein
VSTDLDLRSSCVRLCPTDLLASLGRELLIFSS